MYEALRRRAQKNPLATLFVHTVGCKAFSRTELTSIGGVGCQWCLCGDGRFSQGASRHILW